MTLLLILNAISIIGFLYLYKIVKYDRYDIDTDTKLRDFYTDMNSMSSTIDGVVDALDNANKKISSNVKAVSSISNSITELSNKINSDISKIRVEIDMKCNKSFPTYVYGNPMTIGGFEGESSGVSSVGSLYFNKFDRNGNDTMSWLSGSFIKICDKSNVDSFVSYNIISFDNIGDAYRVNVSYTNGNFDSFSHRNYIIVI